MSGTLGNLSVVLTLDDAGFTVGISRATTAATKLQGAVDGLQRSIAGTGSSFTTATSSAASWGNALSSAAASATAALSQTAASLRDQAVASAAAAAAIRDHAAAFAALKAASAGASSGSGSSSALPFALPQLGSLSSLASGLAGLGAGALSAETAFRELHSQISNVVEAGDSVTRSVSQIQSVLQTSRTVAAGTYDELERAAEATGVRTEDLTRSFVQMEVSLQSIGVGRETVIGLTTTLAQLFQVTGTSGAAGARAIRELNEGLAIGALNLRQLKVIGTDSPALLNALAKAAGVTTGELERMAGAGELTSEKVVAAIQKIGVNVNATFNQIPRSLESARTSLADAADRFRATLDEKLGLSQFLARSDKGMADWLQSVTDNMATAGSQGLKNAQDRLANLKALAANGGGATVIGQFTDPTSIGGMSPAMLQQQITAQEAIVRGLQQQAEAQKTLDDATDHANQQQHQQAEVIDAATKALDSLGIAHAKLTPEIAALSDAIAHGRDVTVPYNDGMLRASQILDMLRDKATPAAQAIAGLNAELVRAQAANLGAAQLKLSEVLLKADPADPTGQGRNLSPSQIAAYRQQVDALLTTTGDKEVSDATNRLKLAQAAARGRAADDHGLSESMERIRQAHAKFIADHGSSPTALSEADEIAAADTQAARLAASSKTAAAQAKPVDNFITELQEKIAGFKATIDDADASEAKFLARIADTKALQGHNTQLTALVHQYEEFKKEAELASKANEANQKVQEFNQTASDALAGYTPPNGIYKTDLQREYLRNAQEINKQIAILQKAIQGGAYNSSPADLATANQRLAYAQQTRQKMDDASLEASFDAMQKEIDTDRLANRQDGGKGELTELETQYGQFSKGIDTLFDDGSLGAGQAALNKKKALEDELAAWVQAKQDTILKANQDQLQKTAAAWGDWEKGLTEAGGQLLDKLASAFEDMGGKGKKAWQAIGTEAVKAIENIVTHLAGSRLLTLMDQLWTGKGANGSGGGLASGSSSSFGGRASGSGGGLGGLLSASGGLSGMLEGLGKSLLPSLFGDNGVTASAVAGNLSLSSGAANDTTGLTAGTFGGFYHSGGLVGHEPTFSRMVASSVFSGAPKYHTGGLAGDEIPAILQKGEGVFTKGQMAAMGMQHDAMASMMRTVSDATKAMTPDNLGTPANYNYNLTGVASNVGSSTGARGAGGAGNVVVNLHNQTGQQHTAVASAPKFDGQKMVLDIVTKAASQPGQFRTALRGSS